MVSNSFSNIGRDSNFLWLIFFRRGGILQTNELVAGHISHIRADAMYASHGGDQGKRGGAEVVAVGTDLNIGVSPGCKAAWFRAKSTTLFNDGLWNSPHITASNPMCNPPSLAMVFNLNTFCWDDEYFVANIKFKRLFLRNDWVRLGVNKYSLRLGVQWNSWAFCKNLIRR